MKCIIRDLKRKLSAELACVRGSLVAVTAGVMLVLGLLFAINGVDAELLSELNYPVLSLPTVLFVLFFAVALASLGLSLACAISSPYRERGRAEKYVLIMYICAAGLVLSWIPLACKAGAFFAAAVVAAVCGTICAVLYRGASRAGRLCGICLFVFALWVAYLVYLSASLFLIN